jgi:lysophospholipase L1-like esterase
MLKNGRPRDIFQADDLHMNADGYRIWTRLLRPKVQEAAKGRCK